MTSALTSVTADIVNYRSADLVGELLASIARRGEAWIGRIIVVDNASEDGSVETLRARATELGIGTRLDVLHAGRNGGFGAGNNIGAAAALQMLPKPDVLWFLNPDTCVDGADLRYVLEWFNCDPHVGVVGTGLADGLCGYNLAGHRTLSPMGEFVRTAGALGILQRYAASDPALDRPGPVDWVSGASLFMRASAYKQLGGFDEGYFLCF